MLHYKHYSHYFPCPLVFFCITRKEKHTFLHSYQTSSTVSQLKNRLDFYSLSHEVPSLAEPVPQQQSGHGVVRSHPNPGCSQIWKSNFPSPFSAATQAQHIVCFWQGTNEVIQPDCHYSQAWIYQGHGEEGKTPRTVPFPSPDEPDATTQRISLGPLAFLLSLLWFSTAARKEPFAPCPLSMLTDAEGQMEPQV